MQSEKIIKILQFALKAIISAVMTLIIALTFSYYPGYLRENSLYESVSQLGLKAMRYGRRELLLLSVAVFAVLILSLILGFYAAKKKDIFRWAILISFLFVFIVNCKDCAGIVFLRRVLYSFLLFIAAVILFVFLVNLFYIYESHHDDIIKFRKNEKERVKEIIKKYNVPFFSSIVIGLISYLWFFTNKILCFDEVCGLFSKGAKLELGRWGLYLVSYLFPDVSLPWLWGFAAVILFSVSSCVIVSVFGINNKLLQCVLAGFIVVFPSEIATMLFMFTVPPYAVAFLLAILAVKMIHSYEKKKKIFLVLCGIAFSVLSLSLYQAYITVTAALLVLLLIIDVINVDFNIKKSIRKFVLKCTSYVLFLAASFALYYGITLILCRISGMEMANYATRSTDNVRSLFERITDTYQAFDDIMTKELNQIVRSEAAKILYTLSLLLGWITGFYLCLKKNDTGKYKYLRLFLFTVFAVFVMPLSLCGLYLALNRISIHVLTLLSFSILFVFVIKMVDLADEKDLLPGSTGLISVVMSFLILGNIFYANKIGFRMYMEYEQTYAAYSSIMSEIHLLEGYNKNYPIAFAGNLPESSSIEYFGFTDENSPFGVGFYRNYYSRSEFIRNFLGYDVDIAVSYDVNRLRKTDEFKEMPSYPNNGYIKIIDNVVVVKLSEESEGFYRSEKDFNGNQKFSIKSDLE